jgi:acyl-[acyl-carrier-protein]-phospholipid O-acyltransferase/long-chain-fatty-acid--[acyl-carrier-protein] ligase
MIIGSDAFLNAYAEAAQTGERTEPRRAVAAGPLRPQTARLWADRFGIPVLEAFDMPQAGGAVAIGSLTHNRAATAGRLLPGMEIRLEPVEGMADGGRVWISGPNVMLGSMHGDTPGILQPPLGGWHDTGEAVSTDREGFFTLHGHAERIVTIEGEIVSLDNVEALANAAWPRARHAAVAIAEKRKPARIVLVTTAREADRETLRKSAEQAGHSEKAVPSEVLKVEELPRTEAGAVDYPRVSGIARAAHRRGARAA